MRLMKLVLGAALVTFALAGCSSKEDRFAAHLKKAQEFFQKEDFDKAGVEIRNAMQINQRSPDAYYWGGRLWENQQQWQQAFGSYMKVLELDPNHYEAKLRLARLFLMARDSAQAEKRITELLAAKPGEPDGRALNAALLAAKGENDKAIVEANRVLEAVPGHIEAASVVGSLLLRQNDARKAQQALEEAIGANGKSVELRALYGTALSQGGDLAKLEANYKAMVELAPKRFETRAALAAFYRQNKQPDKAEKTLREAIEANKEDDQRYLALADLIVANQGVDAAVKEIQAFISARPKAYPIQFKLGQLYNATGRLEEANKAYLGVIAADKTGPSGLQARLQLAGNYVVARRNAEAEKLVEEVLKENPRDNRGLLFRAQLALAKKDNVGAINDLRAVLKDQPGSTQVVSLLANAHRLNKEVPLGREVISSAMKLYPKNADLRLLLADFLFATGDRPGALRELDDLIKQDPRNVRAYEAKAVVQTRGKDFVGAEQTFAALKAATPDSPIGAYRLGLTYSAQRKYDAAVREFESALAKAPNAREVVTALIAAHAAQGKLDQAVARTRQIAKEQPTNFLPHLILGDIYTAQKKYPDAEDAFAKARQLNPRATGVYLGLSRMYSFSGDRSKAAAVLEEGQKTIPNEPVLMLALAEVYQRAGEHDRAIEQYETLLKRNPANDVVANNLAFLLADRKGDKGNLDRALTLAKRFEDSANAAFIDTLGWIHFKRGEHELAVPLLQKAHDQFPTSPSYMYHLGAALLKSGKAAEGKALVQRAIESKEEFANREEARKILASG